MKLVINKRLAYDRDGDPCIRLQGTAHEKQASQANYQVCLDAQRMCEEAMKNDLRDNAWKLEYHPIKELKNLLRSML